MFIPLICYTAKKFSADNRAVIDQANSIFADYRAAGYVLTLRQLYYQFVSRALLANNIQSYKRLGGIINDARLAGLVDWELMEDRTRAIEVPPSWSSPERIIKDCADCFRLDKWADQDVRPEIWIEKEALAGVFERVCSELQVPYFCCRGYTSQSEMWVAGRRMALWEKNGQTPMVLHFGDHDPSGMDMTRDIKDRLDLFGAGGACHIDLRRLALNMDQIEQYAPPPNPAKITDSRAASYIDTYGDESWELDALPPDTLADLVRQAVFGVRDDGRWAAAVEREQLCRAQLAHVSQRWLAITDGL